MPEEIKIVVNQESKGDAIAETRAKIAELNKEAAFFEKQSGLKGNKDSDKDSALAKSIRAEANALQGDLSRQTREQRTAAQAAARESTEEKRKFAAEDKAALKATAEAAKQAGAQKKADEKSVTQEVKEQEAVAKARAGTRSRLVRNVANLAESSVGATGFSGVTSALGTAGGPVGAIAAAVAAVTVGIVASFAKQRDQLAILGFQDQAARSAQGRHMQRMAGFEGSASGLRGEAVDLREDAAARKDNRAELQMESEFKWYNPAGWIDKMTGGSDNKKRQNEAAIGRDEEGAAKADEISRKKYAELVAPEIEIQKKRFAGDMQGARVLEDQLTHLREKNRLLGANATAEEAEAGANAKVALIQKERAGNFAGLVGAKAGAGESTRLAAFAERQLGGADVALKLFHEFQQTRRDINQNHGEAHATAWRKKFSRP